MFFHIDYAERAATRDRPTIDENDDEFDYEQLFDDRDLFPIETKRIKRVRFAPMPNEQSLTPVLSRSSSIQPKFDVEFDFDSLATPSNSTNDQNHWKDAFLNDLQTAKEKQSTTSNVTPMETNENEDSLWDFVKEANPELLHKLQRTTNEKTKRPDRFSTSTKPPEPTNISIVEIRLDKDEFNQIHEELLLFLIPYHKILCEENIWPNGSSLTSANLSFQLIKNICENKENFTLKSNRSEILKHLMFIHTITSFLYVFAYCSLQTAIRHVENVIVQNMRNVCIDQERGKPLFDLLTKTHQKFEAKLHPKIDHIKKMFREFFERRRKMLINLKQIPDAKFLLLVQYEPIDLLNDIERGLSSILELRSLVFDKTTNITREELNDALVYHNLIIIRTRQISPTIIHRPKRLTLIIEYELAEQMPHWYQFCHQHTLAYLAYRTILPTFVVPENPPIKTDVTKEEPISLNSLPTVILARPLVDNFKLLRTLECRHDLSIITRDYHLLGVPIDYQPDVLVDWSTSMLIFDLNTRLDIQVVKQKIQSITLHSCRIHVAILTSGSIPDFILSTYVTPITQLAKTIQEEKNDVEIFIKSFSSLDEFANYVAQLAQKVSITKLTWTPVPSWNEKMLLRRCSSLNSISAQLILQRLANVDLSTVTLDILTKQCPEISVNYLKTFLSDLHSTK